MKVSPLETKNKYGVLEVEETWESGPCPIDPMIVTYYTINFISKLCHPLHQPSQSKNSTPWKIPKSFICSVMQEQDILLTVGLKTVNPHAMIDVEALLDSGATGLFINHESMALPHEYWKTQSQCIILMEPRIKETVLQKK